MSQHCSRSELKNTAKECLAGRYRSVILLTICAMFMTIPITYCQAFLENTVQRLSNGSNALFWDILLYLISSVFIALCSLFNIGIYLFHLNIACKQPYSLSDLFYCFYDGHFNKAFMVSFCTNLPEVICTLPFVICAQLYLQNPSAAMAFYMVLSLIIGIIIQLPIELALSMSFFLILDFPEYSVRDILSHSIQLMKGNKGRLFCIEISFLPLHILGVFSMGIGYLWLTPYINMTRTLFFLDLMKPKSENASAI